MRAPDDLYLAVEDLRRFYEQSRAAAQPCESHRPVHCLQPLQGASRPLKRTASGGLKPVVCPGAHFVGLWCKKEVS